MDLKSRRAMWRPRDFPPGGCHVPTNNISKISVVAAASQSSLSNENINTHLSRHGFGGVLATPADCSGYLPNLIAMRWASIFWAKGRARRTKMGFQLREKAFPKRGYSNARSARNLANFEILDLGSRQPVKPPWSLDPASAAFLRG